MSETAQALLLENRVLTLPIERIAQARLRIRTSAEDTELISLRDSIDQHGLLHPITVRLAPGGMYELISGERRLRALVMLGQRDAPCTIIDCSDLEAALIQLTENLQRESLHFLDEAEAYRRIMSEHSISQSQLAASLGRSQGMIGNRLRLLKLSPLTRHLVRQLNLTERHARALLKLPKEDQQLEAARMAADRMLSVRQLEELILRIQTQPRSSVKYHIRDRRVLINTVLESVNQLRRAGINATSRVVMDDDRTEVIVTWPNGI